MSLAAKDDPKGAMEISSVPEAMEWHADHCERSDAPITARIVRSLVKVMETQTATARRMSSWAGQAMEDALALRAAAGIHALHLSGQEPRLEPVYGGLINDQAQVDAIVTEAVLSFDNLILPWFDSPPQTNEAGRSACVMGALLWLSGKLGEKFELTEIGASAGINTMLGRYFFNLGGIRAGPSLSSMKISPEWRGDAPPACKVEITDIEACDIAPIDLTDKRHADRLKAYIWADAHDRMTRLETAIAMARRAPPPLVQMDAVEFVRGRLARPQEAGVTRALFHTIMWQYLPAESRDAIRAMMEEAGSAATADKPLAWIKVETNRQTFRHELEVKFWPGGGAEWTKLAEAHPHGAWVRWLG